MQWSHETIFAIVIFKIGRLRLWALLGTSVPQTTWFRPLLISKPATVRGVGYWSVVR